MARYIWTLIAGFVLGIYTVIQIVLHVKPLRKASIDVTAKALVDWLHVPEVRQTPAFAGYQRRFSRPDFGRPAGLSLAGGPRRAGHRPDGHAARRLR